ncbi:MAG: RNA polymerase sigma-54 factor [Limisphaerales bacterium]|jgi:RNA polymerase sigma-54 factor
MKQTLALKLGQQLTMTPQLQQAIRLLQLSALDLQAEIQEALETNPMLELSEDGLETEITDHNHEDVQALMDAQLTVRAEEKTDAEVSDQLESNIAEDLPVDTQWDDVYPNSSANTFEGDYDPLANQSAAETLIDHLLWQLNLTPMAASDNFIATLIIDAIDTNGMLTSTTEDILQVVNASAECAGFDIDHEDVINILSQVQEFDPIGVGARDLKECLYLQIQSLPADTPFVNQALVLIEEHLDLIGKKDFTTLRRRSKFGDTELAGAIQLIQTLNPRPGTTIADAPADYIVPDVIVRKDGGRWTVELNNDATPRVQINSLYAGLAKDAKGSKDGAYLRDNLQEARWFLKSLQTRHDTLLRVASRIVEVQRRFFEYGPEAMKPLILADIAEAVDLHESTISRVTSHKYMATPLGVYELKYFFSSHVSTASGGEVSSTAIRALIQKLTADENPKKPLSDNKIAAILKEQNINVARRTVAKYRESLSIPPSNERKQLV